MSRISTFIRRSIVSVFVGAAVSLAGPARAAAAVLPLGSPADTTGVTTTGTTTGTTAVITRRLSATQVTQLAYLMAWRNAQEATHHADALRLTAALATRLGLPSQSPAHHALERFLDAELAANPGRFSANDDPGKALNQLLREDLNGFQRTLSPLLSDECYERYGKMLDSLRLKAETR